MHAEAEWIVALQSKLSEYVFSMRSVAFKFWGIPFKKYWDAYARAITLFFYGCLRHNFNYAHDGGWTWSPWYAVSWLHIKSVSDKSFAERNCHQCKSLRQESVQIRSTPTLAEKDYTSSHIFLVTDRESLPKIVYCPKLCQSKGSSAWI